MKKYIFTFLFNLVLFQLSAQLKRGDRYVTFGLQAGAYSYVGDLSSPDGSISDYAAISRPGFGFFFTKRLIPRLSISFAGSYGQIYGDDNLVSSPNKPEELGRYARNLHFRNFILEGNVTAEFSILPHDGHYSDRKLFDPYILGGFGVLNHNPEARAPAGSLLSGTWVSLPEIGTEGQTIGASEKYSNLQFALLGGFGVNFKISDKASVGVRFAYRQTFTDYLDDVGGAYIDKRRFADGSLSQLLSDRSLEEIAAATGNVRDLQRLQELGLRKFTYSNIDQTVDYETLNGFYPENNGFPESKIPRGGGANDGYWVSSLRFSYIISNTKKDDDLSRIYNVREKSIKKADEVVPDEFLKFTNRYDVSHMVHVSTPFSEIPTGFYKDGILIDSDREDVKNKKGEKKGEFFNVYYVPFSDVKKADLVTPIIVGDDNQEKLNKAGAVYSPDFDRIVLTMFEDIGKLKNEDYQSLYTADAAGENKFVNVQQLGFNNVNYSLSQPSLSADGLALYMATDVPGGYGGTDIYVSYYHKGQWTLPQNLGPSINTEKDEVYPYIHKDGTLYFSSDGHGGMGGLDIFEATKIGNNYFVFNLGSPINSRYNDVGFIINDVKRTGYFSSNRIGGYGYNDIYQVNVRALSKDMLLTGDDNLEDIKEVTVKVNVIDGLTKQPIEGATIKFINTVINQLEVEKSNDKGFNTFTASTGNKYQVGVSAYGFERMKDIDLQDLTKIGDAEEVEMTVEMTSNKVILSVGGFVKFQGVILEDVPVRLINVSDNAIQEFKTNLAGRYLFSVKKDKLYRIEVQGEGYVSDYKEFSTRNKTKSESIKINFDLRKG